MALISLHHQSHLESSGQSKPSVCRKWNICKPNSPSLVSRAYLTDSGSPTPIMCSIPMNVWLIVLWDYSGCLEDFLKSIWKAEWWSLRERERLLYLVVHSQRVHSSWGWAKPLPGSRHLHPGLLHAASLGYHSEVSWLSSGTQALVL